MTPDQITDFLLTSGANKTYIDCLLEGIDTKNRNALTDIAEFVNSQYSQNKSLNITSHNDILQLYSDIGFFFALRKAKTNQLSDFAAAKSKYFEHYIERFSLQKENADLLSETIVDLAYAGFETDAISFRVYAATC